MNLIDAAQAAHAAATTEAAAAKIDRAARQAERQAEEREDFLRTADNRATELFGPAADNLPWQYTPEQDLPEYTSEATAPLPPARGHDLHLACTFHAMQGSVGFSLVETCRSCTSQTTTAVRSLAELGELLDETETAKHYGSSTGQDDGQTAEPGPLAAIEELETHAARLARLARRLLAEHPDTGLTVQYTSLYGHERGGGRAELHLNADSTAAVRQVADAIGAEAELRVSGTTRHFLFRHATAKTTHDGVDVELTACDQLPDDEATAWLTEHAHAFETEDPGESDTKRRLAQCRHCGEDRAAAVHTHLDQAATEGGEG